jgi:xylulokinase
LAAEEPDVFAATRRWHMASSFVVARLTGTWVLDYHSASQCDPLFDLEQQSWNTEWAEIIAPGLPLPPLAWAGETVGTVTPEGSDATGIPEGTPVIAGTIDAWAESVSVGVRRPGDLMLGYGSTMFFILVADQRSSVPTIWTTLGVDPGALTLAAGMATSGSLTAWIRDLTGNPPFGTLVAEAAAVAAGADGLLLLPYFAGERTPILDTRARGVVIGLTLSHGRGHLYRAALEGIAYGARHNLEVMAPHDGLRAVAVGGGTQGDLWAQIVSDVTGMAQEIPRETIGASYGDALLAAEGIGLVPRGSSWATTAAVIAPQAATRDVYSEGYAEYRSLHQATEALQHRLADRQVAVSN